MFKLFVAILAVLPIVVELTPAECNGIDYKQIKSCYNWAFSEPNLLWKEPEGLFDEMITIFGNDSRFEDLCKGKTNLDSCLSNSTIIDRCFDVDSANYFPFGGGGDDDDNKGQRFMANYYQLNYICPEEKDWARRENDTIINAIDACSNFTCHNSSTSGCFANFTDCVQNIVRVSCNPALTCYAKKFAAFQSCYFASDCEMCKSTNFTDILNLCVEDNTPSNVTCVTTTTVLPSTDPQTTPHSNTIQNTFAIIHFGLAFFIAYFFN